MFDRDDEICQIDSNLRRLSSTSFSSMPAN
jgi:hypothetical protein